MIFSKDFQDVFRILKQNLKSIIFTILVICSNAPKKWPKSFDKGHKIRKKSPVSIDKKRIGQKIRKIS